MLYFIQYFQALTPCELLGYLSPSSCLCPLQNSQFASHADKARVGLCSVKLMVRWGVLKVSKKKNKGPVTNFSSSDLICESPLNTTLSITFLAQNFHFILFHSLIWPKLILLPPHTFMNPGFLSATMRLCMLTPLPGMPLSFSFCLPFLRPNPKSHHLKSLAWFLPCYLHTIMLMIKQLIRICNSLLYLSYCIILSCKLFCPHWIRVISID